MKWSSPAPSTTPATIGVSSSRASSASSSPSRASSMGPSTLTTFSGQTMRSASPGASCRVRLVVGEEDLAVVGLLVDGALLAAALDVGDHGLRARRLAPGRHRGPGHGDEHDGAGGRRPASTPAGRRRSAPSRPATVTRPTRRTPPTRATGPSGPAIWPMASSERGTPPKGQRPLTASNTTQAPGSAEPSPAARRHRGHGQAEEGREADDLDHVAGRGEGEHPHRGRAQQAHAGEPGPPEADGGRASATARSNSTSPTRASGQNPHGGSDRAISTPAPSAISAGRNRRASLVPR